MMLPTIAVEIQRFDRKHEKRLDHRVNHMVIQLLDKSNDITTSDVLNSKTIRFSLKFWIKV